MADNRRFTLLLLLLLLCPIDPVVLVTDDLQAECATLPNNVYAHGSCFALNPLVTGDYVTARLACRQIDGYSAHLYWPTERRVYELLTMHLAYAYYKLVGIRRLNESFESDPSALDGWYYEGETDDNTFGPMPSMTPTQLPTRTPYLQPYDAALGVSSGTQNANYPHRSAIYVATVSPNLILHHGKWWNGAQFQQLCQYDDLSIYETQIVKSVMMVTGMRWKRPFTMKKLIASSRLCSAYCLKQCAKIPACQSYSFSRTTDECLLAFAWAKDYGESLEVDDAFDTFDVHRIW